MNVASALGTFSIPHMTLDVAAKHGQWKEEILPSPWRALKHSPDAVVVSSDQPEKLAAAIYKSRK